ncbi:MAG: serine/threonine protein kinase [Deltaproteobacteria bacterium]|nr:serine/threonine protein kinase [Kofleriaceae bacterium]
MAPTLVAPRASVPHALVPGTRVGSYTIERKLAEGGMAIVYEAVHQVLPRRAALKVMRDASLGESARTRFLREACLLADLRHRAIVDVHDAGMLADGRAWLVMNLVNGTTLADRLLVRGALTPAEVVELVRHIAAALASAHEAGVVHRDLKPENVFVVDDAACPVRVIDWGIALAAHQAEERLTVDGTITGTPHYMAPEQIRGELVDGKCDVYSLGIMMYELLAGQPPFEGGMMDIIAHQLTAAPPPLCVRAPATPVWLAALVNMMLAKQRAQRPTMAQVMAALDGLTPRVRTLAADGEDDDLVIEMTADMEEDEVDHELDQLIAELSPEPVATLAPALRRIALGSNG